MQWHSWEPVHRDNELMAANRTFGRPVERLYDVRAAEILLGIDSDLVSTSPGWLAYSRELAANRRPNETGGKMSRIYAIESTPTLLGAKADHRLPLRPEEIAQAMRYIAGRLGAGPQEWSQQDSPHATWLGALCDDLAWKKGRALLHAGREQSVEVHVLTDAINGALGGFGKTVRVIAPVIEAQPHQDSLKRLTQDMAAGAVDTLLILGANPVYDAPADLDFAGALKHVPFSASLSLYDDETALACTWRLPARHEYELWGDARAFEGTITIQQPQIRPLYGGRSATEVLEVLLGNPSPDEYGLVRQLWQQRAQQENRGDFESFWYEAVRGGIVANTAAAPLQLTPKADVAAELNVAPAQIGSGLVGLFRPDEGLWDGRYAMNPWLLEMARPFTRLTWDNAALMAPATAARLGLATNDLVDIAAGERKLRMPVFVLPGQAKDCVTLALGWGREAGGLGAGAGFDTYRLRTTAHPWTLPISSIDKVSGPEPFKLATTQGHDRVAGRDLIREATLEQFTDDPHSIVKKSADASLYPPFEYPERAWGMSIDLNSCIGCQACTIACQAENNVPVVGKDQVLAQRVMHWLRIDRYYSGPADAPDIAFEPMPCMHCENAPCEVVCPVHATVHDHEGLNLMVYNRCVGTRFCSNNCPYKVRRFNFFTYSTAIERRAESWNPEVSVRERGVMEKCTYCIQRIRTTQIDAERESRPIRDGEVVTACQQSCPTQAIVFGDLNDASSKVVQRKRTPTDYVLLEELNTRPRTSYGALIRNPNPAIKSSRS